tara:strand:+ start:3784 stop:5418 length:1635 start_codon:yes stop_codon:yes gene_type:complete
MTTYSIVNPEIELDPSLIKGGPEEEELDPSLIKGGPEVINQLKTELDPPVWQWWADKAESRPGIEDDIYRGIGTAAKGVWGGLKAYGEATDALDKAVGLPGTDYDLYAARHSLIDPLAEKHFLLGLAGEVILPDSVDVATWGLTYIPNRILKAGKSIKTWARMRTALDGVDPIVDALKKYSPEEVSRMAAAGEIEGIPKGSNIFWSVGDNSDEYIDILGKAETPTRPVPLWDTKGEVASSAFETVINSTYYANKYGQSNIRKVADFMQDAYITVGNTGGLKGAGRIEIDGILYKARANNGMANVNVRLGTGLKLAPMVNNRQLDAIRRLGWEWNKNTENLVRQWFANAGAAPHIAENYIAIQKADASNIKNLVTATNKELKRLNPNIKRADLLSVGHGKSLSKGGPDVSRNRFLENLGKNAQRGDKNDLPDIILKMLGNPLTIEEDMARFLMGPSWYKDFFQELGPEIKAKWATMIGKGIDPDDALQIIWEEGGEAVRKNPFFKNWHENVKMSDSWSRNQRWLGGEWGPPQFRDDKHGGWLYKR